jgi:5-methylcytosine-specific restriction endonuclease McrA
VRIYKTSLASRKAKKAWALRNPEKVKALSKFWSVKNRERNNELARRRYAANPEKYHAILRAKRDKGRPAYNEKERLRKLTPEYRARRVIYQSRRRAQQTGNTVNTQSINLFIELMRSRKSVSCYYCKNHFSGSTIHFDHIIPLSRGGAHSVTNLCASCPSCNLQKGAKTPAEWIGTGQQVFSV